MRVRNRLWIYLILWSIYPLLAVYVAFLLARDIFDAVNMTGMGIFVGGVALLSECAYFAWPKYKKFAFVFAICATTLFAIGVDAFIVEPSWLDVRHETVTSSKIDKPLRMVVISDLQTDHVGVFEKEVLKKTMAEHPDMVLFPGDYIEALPSRQREEMAKLRQCMIDEHVSAPLGVYAVEGDHEATEWQEIFAGLPIRGFPRSATICNARVAVTGLTLKDSYSLNYQIPHEDKFHIVFGHRPDFSLRAGEGDLFIAGHTHGGQVQLPFFGPLVTFSDVPRRWCGGCNVKINNNRSNLIISRGVGMERGLAPRLRFFCRPEIVVVDVLPERG